MELFYIPCSGVSLKPPGAGFRFSGFSTEKKFEILIFVQ